MEPEIKKEHKFLPVLITVLIMLLITGGVGAGVWYYMGQQAKRDKEELQNQINDLRKSKTSVVTTESTTSNATTDETANWKIYTSTVYGFSMKYPQAWTVNDTSPIISNSVAEPNPQIIFKDNGNIDFRIYASKQGAGWGFEGVKFAVQYKTTVNNKEIILGARTAGGENPIPESSGFLVGTQNDVLIGSTYYLFQLTNSSTTQMTADDVLFKKVISTIRFN